MVVPRPAILSDMRIDLKKKLKGTITLIKEKTSFHPNIEFAIDELKDNILLLRDETIKCIQLVEKDLKSSVNYEYDNEIASFHQRHLIEQRSLSEIWRVSYNFGIELENECIKFMTQDRAELYSKGLAEFCIMWSDYIVGTTERGKGRTVRPWAAKKGIQLMSLAWQNSSALKDTEFTRLKTAIESCLVHVIGGRGTRNTSGNRLLSGHGHGGGGAGDLQVIELKSSISMVMPNAGKHHSNDSQQQLAMHSHQMSVPQQLFKEAASGSTTASVVKSLNCKSAPSRRFRHACHHEDKRREKSLLVRSLCFYLIIICISPTEFHEIW